MCALASPREVGLQLLRRLAYWRCQSAVSLSVHLTLCGLTMPLHASSTIRTPLFTDVVTNRDSSGTSSGVSWAAILAGAVAAAALSLILLILGTGLGLSAV